MYLSVKFPIRAEDGHIYAIGGFSADVTDAAALERERAELAALVQSSDDAIIGKTLDGIITSWNRAAERMYGYSSTEAVGSHISMLVPADVHDELADILDAIRGGESVSHLETSRRRKDGTLVDVSVTVSPIWDGTGRVVGASSIARDVTDHNRLLAAIRREASRTAAILQSAAEGIVELDADSRVEFANPAARAMLDLVDEDPIGRPWREVAGAQDEHLALLQDTISSGASYSTTDEPLTTLSGRSLIAECSLAPVRDGRGATGAVVTFDDITVRREAEAELRRMRGHLTAAQSAAGMGSFESDPRTGAVFWSGAIAHLHNLPVETPPSFEAVTTNLSASEAARVAAGRERCLETGEPFELDYAVEASAFGPARVVHLHCSRTNAGDGRLGILGTCQDVTDRVRRERAERANQAKSEFLSRMSHELRTPLNAVLGFGELLERDALSEQQHQNVGRILVAGRSLLETINDVLDISRIEAGKLDLEFEPTGLAAVVRDVAAIVEPLAAARNQTLLIDVPDGLAACWSDRRSLRQAVLNLLSNAIKYNRDDGTVTVSVMEGTSGGAAIVVSDQGHGIPAELLPRLFAPFDRLGAERGHVDGTGLGLTVTKSLVEAMGGTITVDSRPGAGSSFAIELSTVEVAPTDAQVNAAELPPHPPGPSAVSRVLCIDASRTTLSLIRAVMGGDRRFELLTADSGGAGLELARRPGPEGVPARSRSRRISSGWWVLGELEHDPSTAHIPMVVLTRDPEPRNQSGQPMPPGHTYICKPLEPAAFYRAVDELLESSLAK